MDERDRRQRDNRDRFNSDDPPIHGLADTEPSPPPDDGLVVGIRTEPRWEVPARRRSGGGGALAMGILVLGALAAGGYYYWQTGQAGEASAVAAPPMAANASDAAPAGETPAESGEDDPQASKLQNKIVAAEPDREQRQEQPQKDDSARPTEGEQLAALLAEGESLAKSGELAAAGEQYAAALRLDPDSSRARQALDGTVEALAARAEAAIARGEFAAAGDDLDRAAALAPGRQGLAERRAELPALEAARESERALAQARAALDRGDFAGAADRYRALLEDTAVAGAAAEGLENSVDGLVEQARGDIDSQHFDAAREKLATAREALPEHGGAEDLAARLPELERAWKAEQAAIARREREANERANAVLAAMGQGNLDAARQRFDILVDNHPNMAVTRDVRSRLMKAYAETAKEEIEVQSYDRARQLIGEGEVMAPELAVWETLREELDYQENNERRRLGAY